MGIIEKYDEELAKLLRRGMTPAEIDRALMLPKGTAHRTIVSLWALDLEEYRERQRAGRR